MNPPVDPVVSLVELLRCPSVTPEEAGVLDVLTAQLSSMGFACRRETFTGGGSHAVDNLHATLPGEGPHLLFAGHTDVVPAGDPATWKYPPFSATIADGEVYGRGAVDMKGGIAAFVAAVARRLQRHGRPSGSLSLLITNDEEGPAINGTVRLLASCAARGERWDGAIVGEPTCRERIGDMVKIGRRGSLSGVLWVEGRQGHVAYPHLAENPVPALLGLAGELLRLPLDGGTDRFQRSNLEITSIDTGNRATNVIPGRIEARFNIRFNDLWTELSLCAAIEARLALAAADFERRHAVQPRFGVEWLHPASPVFLTHESRLIESLSAAIGTATGLQPELSTSGGTSDARFIKDYCPVVEFGLVGQSMHRTDERVSLVDLEALTKVYECFLDYWFSASAGE